MPISPHPPDFIERQFVNKPHPFKSICLQRQMVNRMKDRGATWGEFTYLPEEKQLILKGWLIRPKSY
jgi:hypothetical protein